MVMRQVRQRVAAEVLPGSTMRDAALPQVGRRLAHMVHITGEIDIRRPVDEVFDFVADATNEPLYNPLLLRAEKTTDGPIGIGASGMRS
jgi:hypothetical protein